MGAAWEWHGMCELAVSVVTEYRLNNQSFISTTATLPRPDTEGCRTGDKAAGT
jgi:hypothetical protein